VRVIRGSAAVSSRILNGAAFPSRAVWDFDFGHTYGSHGLDYIECHHRTPLHVTGETQTRLADLALLCSNRHRMIHRTRRWLTVEELKDLVAAQRAVLADAPASS
jgi:hypothetical protein